MILVIRSECMLIMREFDDDGDELDDDADYLLSFF